MTSEEDPLPEPLLSSSSSKQDRSMNIVDGWSVLDDAAFSSSDDLDEHAGQSIDDTDAASIINLPTDDDEDEGEGDTGSLDGTSLVDDSCGEEEETDGYVIEEVNDGCCDELNGQELQLDQSSKQQQQQQQEQQQSSHHKQSQQVLQEQQESLQWETKMHDSQDSLDRSDLIMPRLNDSNMTTKSTFDSTAIIAPSASEIEGMHDVDKGNEKPPFAFQANREKDIQLLRRIIDNLGISMEGLGDALNTPLNDTEQIEEKREDAHEEEPVQESNPPTNPLRVLYFTPEAVRQRFCVEFENSRDLSPEAIKNAIKHVYGNNQEYKTDINPLSKYDGVEFQQCTGFKAEFAWFSPCHITMYLKDGSSQKFELFGENEPPRDCHDYFDPKLLSSMTPSELGKGLLLIYRILYCLVVALLALLIVFVIFWFFPIKGTQILRTSQYIENRDPVMPLQPPKDLLVSQKAAMRACFADKPSLDMRAILKIQAEMELQEEDEESPDTYFTAHVATPCHAVVKVPVVPMPETLGNGVLTYKMEALVDGKKVQYEMASLFSGTYALLRFSPDEIQDESISLDIKHHWGKETVPLKFNRQEPIDFKSHAEQLQQAFRSFQERIAEVNANWWESAKDMAHDFGQVAQEESSFWRNASSLVLDQAIEKAGFLHERFNRLNFSRKHMARAALKLQKRRADLLAKIQKQREESREKGEGLSALMKNLTREAWVRMNPFQ
ncbi:hypothetical protein AAP_05833 [Ascosphaera apis ARSEF 7405]|uniref:Uncharacterized protein n=1 Tax=Ascosphaera apis ARSEF 7405 TaxID=392613 RepID=A0A167V8I5_9EURO|nr:hypothetical protein AAP_05833 [Ascosphaera apis ARSEF 7405]